MSDHQQAAKPQGLDLADEAVLPTGHHCAGTKARVYNLLEWAAARSHQFSIGRHLAPAGWVPTWILREPWAGGAAGDRRVRDLRADGVDIEGKAFETEVQGTASWVFRLGPASTSPRQAVTSPTDTAAPTSPGPLAGLLFDVGFSRSAAGDFPVCALAEPWLAVPAAGEADRPALYREALVNAWRSGELRAALEGLPELFFLFPEGEDALADVLESVLLRLGARRRVGP